MEGHFKTRQPFLDPSGPKRPSYFKRAHVVLGRGQKTCWPPFGRLGGRAWMPPPLRPPLLSPFIGRGSIIAFTHRFGVSRRCQRYSAVTWAFRKKHADTRRHQGSPISLDPSLASLMAAEICLKCVIWLLLHAQDNQEDPVPQISLCRP